MGFNSFNFIVIFLPVLLCIRHVLNKTGKYRAADVFLILMSLYYYYSFGMSFLVILLVSIAVNYFLSFLIEKRNDIRGILGCVGVVFNLGLLFYFKYLGFFVDNINAITGKGFSVKEILMPIGISFFTFGQISFIVDRSRGEARHYDFLNYALYTVYFPKLIQGPIAFHKEMIDQFEDRSLRRFDSDLFARGLMSFVIGLGKKVLLADKLALSVNYGFHYTYYMDTITGILVMIAYTFQIYLDFSGYCDMASGVSMMLGYRLPDNFNSPYKASSCKQLWQRWHMTLSRFFIKYVYIPLGGSRKGKVRTMLNVLIVFVLSGLWHGAGWTYICWGLMQGLLVVWDDLGIIGVNDPLDDKSGKGRKYLLREKPLLIVPRAVGNAFTFLMFVLSLVFFRSQDMTYAIQMFRQFFFFTYPGFLYRTASQLDIAEVYIPKQIMTVLGISGGDNIVYVCAFLLLLAVSAFIMTRKSTREIVEETSFGTKTVIGIAIVFVWSFISLSNVSTFIYFQY